MHSLKMPSASSNKPQCVLPDTGEETKECTQNTGRRSLGCLDMFVRARVFICWWCICIYVRMHIEHILTNIMCIKYLDS